jgi:hypothetical protein
MPFKFKLSKRLALLKASLTASAILTLACTSDLTDPQPHRNSLTPVAIASDLAPLAAAAVAASGYQDPNIPQNTLDNNLATRWSANGDGQWIRYDLGTTIAVGSVTIAWYQGTAWAAAFEIQVSLDGTAWTPVFTGRSSGQTLQPERYDFSTVTARYVRIVGHGQWSGTTLLSLWNSPEMQHLRRSHDTPDGPSSCKTCYMTLRGRDSLAKRKERFVRLANSARN